VASDASSNNEKHIAHAIQRTSEVSNRRDGGQAKGAHFGIGFIDNTSESERGLK
jgi:hypothetical protein